MRPGHRIWPFYEMISRYGRARGRDLARATVVSTVECCTAVASLVGFLSVRAPSI